MKFSLVSFITLFFITASAQVKNAKDVDNLIKSMSLEEKVGQMTQITLAVVVKDGWSNTNGTLDPVALKKAINTYKVGSILNTTAHAFSLETWIKVITEIQNQTKSNRFKIPVIYGLDAIHGQTYTLESTLFPHNIAMAASRDVDNVKAVAKVTALELRASGVRWNFDPVLDIGRQPLWSRFPETFGEDVLLGKMMGSAAVRAYEEDGLKNTTAVASCLKHFIAYSASRNGKDRTPIYMPDIELREYYLPQFREAIKVGSASVMVNSTEINGVPVHSNKYLLTDVLRNELHFEGVIVTDWEDLKRLHTWHKVASSPRMAVAMGINAGIDMSMVPADFSFAELLIEAVNKGEVKMSRIDDAVRRILLMKLKVGLFDNPYPETEALANFKKPAYQSIALKTAQDAMTLLKNTDNILPLSKNKKILIAGPSAQSLSALNGCWSYTWQGNEEDWYPTDSKTILQTITDKVGAANVVTTTGKGFNNTQNYNTDALMAAAKEVDVIVLCIGEDAYAESPGNIKDLALDPNQVALAEAAYKTGKPVILVLTEGRPRFISTIEPPAKGILMAYWSGKKSAEAIADVLFGDVNPSGILPFTYSRSMGEIVMYDRKPSEEVREIFNNDIHTGYDPLFAFGHGLSYTSFEYTNMQLNTKQLKANQNLVVTISVKNTGKIAGKHTVELYTHDQYATITPCVKRLRAFKKIALQPGESTIVTFTINKNDLAFVNRQLNTVTEDGDFDVMIGKEKQTFNYKN